MNSKYGYFQNIKLYTHLQRIVTSESYISRRTLKDFKLWMLETRVLDFKNVIITSVNEGVIPSGSRQNTFIPFDVKVQFGLPTYREKDAIFPITFLGYKTKTSSLYTILKMTIMQR